MISHIILDLDGTLYEQKSVVLTYLKKFCQRYNLNFEQTEQDYKKAYGEVKETGKQYSDIRSFFTEVNKQFLPLIKFKSEQHYLVLLDSLAEQAKKEVLLYISPRKGVKEFLQYAKQKKLNTVVFTGGHEIHTNITLNKPDVHETLAFKEQQIEILGLKQFIDKIIPSSQFGGYKPQRIVFERLLQYLNCQGTSCVMIGNSSQDMAAEQVGMTTILLSDKKITDWNPTYRANDFLEIRKIVQELCE